jgi:hypothetical protein
MPETGAGTQGLAKTSTSVSITPALFSYKGRRGRLGVLMPETGEEMLGLSQKSDSCKEIENQIRYSPLPWG